MIIIKYFKKNSILIFILLLSHLIIVVTTVWQPTIIHNIVDTLNFKNNVHTFHLIYQLLLLSVFSLTGGIINSISSAYLSKNISSKLREETFKKVLTFSISEINKIGESGLTIRLTNDINHIRVSIPIFFDLIFRLPLLIIFSCFMAIITVPIMWWVILLLIVTIIIISIWISYKISKNYIHNQIALEKLNNLSKENIEGIKLIKSYVQYDEELNKFILSSNKLKDINIKIAKVLSLIMPSFLFIGNIFTLIVIILGYLYFSSDPKGAGYIVAFMSYMLQMMVGIVTAGITTIALAQGFIAVKRIKDIFQNTTDATNKIQTYNFPEHPTIEFRNVSFKYPDSDYYAIQNISFKINYGDTIAIIGESGSGKTTIANLITNLFNVTEGIIYVGGISINDLTREDINKNIAYALQNPILKKGTIKSNLTQRKQHITNKYIYKSLEVSECLDFVRNLNKQVEEKGNNFSGGQRKRLSIAQEIITRSKINIFDDVTDSLDLLTAKKVFSNLNNFLKDRTIIYTSQNLPNSLKVDIVLLLKDGKLKSYKKGDTNK
ncbi:ABC transporter ATP-binding protein/permease [Staphylococcus epidermidis]|uniref:ABC transporter ATP-binding protein n=1 Tax=Staphylococcus epidermidis TaxID=1282 RepID=UPI00138AD33F|nr:ABC transporter ATP-binding protein [Staphylococcus epidermidis]MCG1176232.1 ABC transporter ATP-binding protein/permease [Staphylococcus epidermidis]MCG1339924.1 ABC transporter ATP-binding protein/permease [Staphylococcus epidermidis]MCG1389088.1 ABC transporter ATP-binding protein/permease [Staphylococcus epidermidis]MCG1416398.1 ABC transporter ATP-binding protein/permease [Staphylococcus epidermidis]MCG1466478.1 ABC transporter ATP-binding protein/permease [Staphylococcus epidermidis]